MDALARGPALKGVFGLRDGEAQRRGGLDDPTIESRPARRHGLVTVRVHDEPAVPAFGYLDKILGTGDLAGFPEGELGPGRGGVGGGCRRSDHRAEERKGKSRPLKRRPRPPPAR
jgi:hypothetical protein